MNSNFHLADTPLRPGTTLIEASAGTGKTFTIAGLILRLVLEEGIGIGQILAVTYTVAATEELRDRVRRRLRDALADLRRGESDDETVRKFLKGDSVKKGIAALDVAVQNFDEAQIFTIHGFCQRVLRENAFESGALFDTELMTDAAPLLDEVSQDFWRQRLYTAPPLLARLALAQGISHHTWTKLLGRLRNHPDIRIIPEAGEHDCANLAKKLEEGFSKIIALWKSSGKEVEDTLRNHESLLRGETSFRPDKVDEIVRAFDDLSGDIDETSPGSLKVIQQLSAAEIAGKIRKGKVPPRHPLFDLCGEFDALTQRFFSELTLEFIAFARRETSLRKATLNMVTYDDLLTQLRDALDGPGGKVFARELGGKYRAALIDEFQDTDPVQYEIFHNIFAHGGHHLYFIGDPKQAIYGFRGADVFTYLKAARGAGEKFTLGTNFRSEKRLLDAMNLLFEKHPSLGRDEIQYHAVSPPEKPRAGFEELTGDERESRLRFRFLRSDEEGKGINQANAEESISRAVVADIARLKAGGAKLGTRELKYGDMAVLVRTNDQAVTLQEMLRERGIKSVLKTDRSVFKTGEARETLMLLEALLEPGRGHFLNTALVTSLIGLDPAEIVSLGEEESRRQSKLEEFLEYRELWKESCFMEVFRKLLVEQNVRERLVQLPGGERKLTNFLHLSELLHAEETARRLTPDALRLWLRKQIHSEESVDEHQLRLESDGDGVLIATIHKSKGLEYPIVFCPFLWKPADSVKRTELLFHDPAVEDRLTFDLRDKNEVPAHDQLTGEERLGESLRMLYVALTRAQNVCHVYAGDISKNDTSPLATILGGAPPLPLIEALAKKSGGTIDVTMIDHTADALVKAPPASDVEDGQLRACEFAGTISRTRMITSFSALIFDSAKEEPDRDAGEAEEPVVKITEDVLPDFERGVRAGLFWHDVLEHLDFQKPEGIDTLVADKLASHGMNATHAEYACARLRQLLKTQLQPGLSLSQISTAARLAEVEFSYPIASLTPERVREVFAKHGGLEMGADFSRNLGRLKFQPVEGFMRGFIDLIFEFDGCYYIVDWKSNRLGPSMEDYDAAGLNAIMTGSFYFLQYHLYTVAVEMFLRGRIPGFDYEKHFGGVFYIFLRGVDATNPERGIFQARPDAGLIRDLRETLTGRCP